MNPSTPETPAPLPFDSPQVQAARTLASSLSWLKSEACLAALDVIEHAVPCNDRDSLDTHEEIGRILADALTHEHEARVRAEEELEQWKDRDYSLQATCAKISLRADKAEAERDSLRNALARASGIIGKRIAVEESTATDYSEQDWIDARKVFSELQLMLSGLPAQPSAGALGERENGK